MRFRFYVNMEMDPPPFWCAPPHAGFAPVLAVLDRGRNYHGSLREYLYACTDNDSDPSRVVLWIGDTGSQGDDDIGRLTPIAWIDYKDQNHEEWGWSSSYEKQLLSELLAVTVAEWIKACWIEATLCLEDSDVLTDAELEACWARACSLASR